MAEPLTLSFQADTSRATSAMQSLSASVIGNMTSIGVAMAGGAANANAFGGSLQGLTSNVSRAAQAVGVDVRKIATDTANAATKDKATLEGVVQSFTRAAAGSNTAQATVAAGINGTSTAVTTLVAQVPMLKTMLGVFLAFEAAKLIFDAIGGSIDTAREHVEKFVSIQKDAEKAGVGTSFFQRATGEAKELGLTVQQVTAALAAARAATDVKLGEGKGATNTSSLDSLLSQNVKARNISAADKATIDGVDGQEAKIKAVLDLIEKLRASGKDLAAFDLAGKFLGADFEKRMREGSDIVGKLKAQLASSATATPSGRIVSPEEIERANHLDAKLQDISRTFATALAPIQKDISNAALDTYDAFVKVEAVIAKVVTIASNLYVQISGIVQSVKDFVNQIPGIGKVLTASNPLTALRAAGEAVGLIDAAPSDGSKPLEITVGAGRGNGQGDRKSNPLPGLAGRSSGSDTEQLDAVEQLISQIEKARDTAKAELETVGKTNVERERAVALAKAEAAARDDFKKGLRTSPGLDDDEKERILDRATSWQTYKDRVMDTQQALRAAAEQARYFGQMATDALSDAILEGKSFSDILNSIANQMFRAGLQGLLTGQGPLASLLNTAPLASAGPNAVGGLAGGLATALGFRANGGPVEAGHAYTVGEVGRELFIPNQGGRMVPIERGAGAGAGAGGGGMIRMGDVNIHAPGADRQGLLELKAYVDLGFRENRRTFGQQFAGWKEDN